jgi:subtilisin family serine protease
MSAPEDRFRLFVYVHDDDAAALAVEVLRRVDPESVSVAQGVVSGVATAAELGEVMEHGLLVDVQPIGRVESPVAERDSADARQERARRLKSFLRKGENQPPRRDVFRGSATSDADDDSMMGIEIRRGRPAFKFDDVFTITGRGTVSRSEEEVYEVLIDRPIDAEIRAAFEGLGLKLLSYRAPATYRFALTRRKAADVRNLAFVREVERYGPERTVGDDVVEAVEAEGSTGARTFHLTVHRAQDLDTVRAAIEAEPGAEVLDAGGVAIRFRSSAGAAFLSRLVRRMEVATLNLYEPPRLRADLSRELMGLDALTPPPAGGAWDGTGETVAIFDSGVDATHPDLVNRLAARTRYGRGGEDDLGGHGTHVAGIIAGDGSVPGSSVRGIAPGAKIVSVGMAYGSSEHPHLDMPADLGALLELAVREGAAIVNLSWGEPLGARYEQGALSIDHFTHAHPDVLVVVAAGNEGTAPRGLRELYRVGTPATAKNVVTVGATLGKRPEFAERTWGKWKSGFHDPEGRGPMSGDPDQVAALSSTGPTEWGMVKPDVVAPGTFILSARALGAGKGVVWEGRAEPNDGNGREWYCYSSGTSMAAPAVSGAAAVVRQYLRSAPGAPVPSAALLKAVLIAAAQPVPSRRSAEEQEGIGFPDFDQGFGRVDLRSVLPHPAAPPGRKLLYADVRSGTPGALVSGARQELGEKGVRAYRVAVPPGATAPLRVVLTWTDPPGPSVHNKLRLSVRGPGELLGLGNAGHRFGRNPVMEALAPGRQQFDQHNTVESVHIPAPPPGTYYVRVLAHNTPTPGQGYALVVSGELAEDALA